MNEINIIYEIIKDDQALMSGKNYNLAWNNLISPANLIILSIQTIHRTPIFITYIKDSVTITEEYNSLDNKLLTPKMKTTTLNKIQDIY